MIGMQGIRLALAVAGVWALTSGAAAQTFNQPGSGKQLYDGLCQDCHGLDGIGDEAPAVNHLSDTSDEAVNRIMRQHAPGGGPLGVAGARVRRLTDDETRVLVAYVQMLNRGAPEAVTGNAERGRSVYASLDCSTCHVVGGAGGVLGPELTKVGARRAPSFLRKTLIDPGVELPKGSFGVLINGFSEYLPVSVVENSGREVRGIRVNEDSFTIQVRDADGKFYSFRKGDVQNIDKQIGRSLMPNYRERLSNAQLDDLVAYLVSLGGRK
jgi:putative heme-binding domain-containing protein